jgi:putative membrane protein
MSLGIAVAWIHYVGIMLLMASVLGEHLLLKPQISLASAQSIQRLDIIFGASATLVLITGVARMYLEKGVSYYLHHGAFHILLGLFIIIGLLSIYPTMAFLKWGSDTRAGHAPDVPAAQLKRLQMILRAEMALLVVAPLFAAWMAHGPF